MTSVHRRVSARVANGKTDSWDPAKIGLHFDTDNPFEVRITVTEGNETTTPPWLFDRTLLKAACITAGSTFGRGDVQVGHMPGPGGLRLRLSIAGCFLDLLCAREPVAEFIVRIDEISPPDQASYDVDAWLSELHGGTA